MAEAASKLGKGVTKTADPLTRKVEKTLRRKGFDPVESFAKGKREEKEAEREQSQLVGKQKQAETLRLAEAEDVVGRKRLQAAVGGRQSLVIGGAKRLKKIPGTQPLVPRV